MNRILEFINENKTLFWIKPHDSIIFLVSHLFLRNDIFQSNKGLKYKWNTYKLNTGNVILINGITYYNLDNS